ncbi:MAG TPA: hypothetical protein VF290_02395 [Pyrinomonadaceae bacterium]
MITSNKKYNFITHALKPALIMTCLFVLTSVTAMAQAPCTPVDIAPPADPALLVFELEGKIQSYNNTTRTITANGQTIFIPTTVLVETRSRDLTGNITLANLTDATLEAQRSIVGGSVIASGDLVFSQGPSGNCVSLNATQVYVELAENVIVGLLSNVDTAAGTFRVNGTLVRMNADPRFPKDILDVGSNQLTITDLASHAGEDISVGGYYDAAQNVLFGTLVETEFVKALPGQDGVAITKTEGRTGNRELRVEGQNARNPQGQFAASVTVFSGGLDAAGTQCAGTQLGTAAVSTIDGAWSFRQRNITPPSQVCVKSPFGGIDASAVTFTN